MNTNIIDDPIYLEDVAYLASLSLPWGLFSGKSIAVSGATGMIGSCFIDVIMHKNFVDGLNCRIYAIGRNKVKAQTRFYYWWNSDLFHFFECDVNDSTLVGMLPEQSYVIHLASNTHPVAYSTDPVNTIMTNIIGTQNMLELARKSSARFAFASSNEVYGENRGDVELFDEKYCGYIDSNTLRAGYPESKRCGEALCQAYAKQYGMDVVIPRFTRSYGPTLLTSDTKALSQFLRNALDGSDIVLKSEGKQFFSYTYVADAVAGLLFVLLKGKPGEAYNIADVPSDITLRELALMIARCAGTQVVFDIPDSVEADGFSKATKARLDGSKIKSLGWTMRYDIQEGISRTMKILKNA